MCLRTRGISDTTATFGVEAAGQVYKQTHDFLYLGGNVITTPTCPSRSTGALATPGAVSGRILSNCTTDRAPPVELKIRMLKAEVLETMLYSCVTWSPRACHYDTLRGARHSFLTRSIGWRNVLVSTIRSPNSKPL